MPPDACSSPLSEMLLSPPRFPILMLDEAKLTPALGYLFHRKWLDPYESLVSILWKFEKANGLSGSVVAHLMGPDVDPYEGLVPELGAVDIDRLHGALGLPKTTLRDALLAPTERRRFCATFRHCRRCIAHGYHSVVHQVDTVYRCPAHHDMLESACRKCGYEVPYRVNVQLLETPYRCSQCRESYGGHGWRPTEARPMRAGYCKALARKYVGCALGL